MLSEITQYRADFYKNVGDVKFSVDSDPENDPDADTVPLRIVAAVIQEEGDEVVRWLRPELESFIGAQVTASSDDEVVVFTFAPVGGPSVFTPALTAGIMCVEAFAVNRIGGVKKGCLLMVGNASIDDLVLPSTANYVLQRLTYPLTEHLTLFDNNEKRKGRRKRKNA